MIFFYLYFEFNMTTKPINIPIFSIKPNNQIIDYLINDNSTLAITNPWHTFKGTNSIDIKEYLKISKSIDKKTNTQNGYSIKTPQIIYKSLNNEFTANILFTNDKGENSLTTRFKPFSLWKTPKTEYATKFKSLQKVLCSRGKYVETNEELTNELVINYQLTQVLEIAILLKMFGYDSSALGTDLTDEDVIKQLLKEFKDITISEDQDMYNSQLKKVETAINEYINFINPKNKQRFIIRNDDKTKSTNKKTKAFIPDLFIIFSNLLKFIYDNGDSDNHGMIIEYYGALTGDGKINLKPFEPVTYVKYYSVDTTDKKHIEGYGVYTNYTFMSGEYGNTKTKKSNKGPQVALTPADHAKMADSPQIGKFWNKFDFDCRTYLTIADKSPTCLRYTVRTLLYKPSVFTGTEVDGVDDVDIGMDDAVVGGFGDNPEDNVDLDEQVE